MDLDVALGQAADLLARSQHTVVLTGAGVSKESGVPTFRGKDGLWTKQGEPPMNGFDIWLSDPAEAWRRKLAREDAPDEFMHLLRSAQPNAGHHALAELERMGIVKHLITQNGDYLHAKAGQQSITEVHGNIYWLRCIDCHARWPQEQVTIDPTNLPPRCLVPGCGGVVKGDSVGFGEPVPPYALRRCGEETQLADVFLTVGTTAVVYPVAHYPQYAVQLGIPLIEVDPEPTAISDLATVILRGPSGEVLPRLVEAVKLRQRTN
jgi:NAD-dependent deacetylase